MITSYWIYSCSAGGVLDNSVEGNTSNQCFGFWMLKLPRSFRFYYFLYPFCCFRCIHSGFFTSCVEEFGGCFDGVGLLGSVHASGERVTVFFDRPGMGWLGLASISRMATV